MLAASARLALEEAERYVLALGEARACARRFGETGCGTGCETGCETPWYGKSLNPFADDSSAISVLREAIP